MHRRLETTMTTIHLRLLHTDNSPATELVEMVVEPVATINNNSSSLTIVRILTILPVTAAIHRRRELVAPIITMTALMTIITVVATTKVETIRPIIIRPIFIKISPISRRTMVAIMAMEMEDIIIIVGIERAASPLVALATRLLVIITATITMSVVVARMTTTIARTINRIRLEVEKINKAM